MIQFPTKKFKIILVDPPWQYNEDWGNGSFKHTYQGMNLEDIKNLPVQQITDDECHLYLWVTNPFIKEGLEVCKAWGFEYKTLITWIKTYKDGTPEMGMGYYFRSCTEHIIFAVKGKMKIKNKVTRNMFKAVNDRTLHSSKPDCVKKMIVECSGDLPRIELFARQKVEGWDVWGNEAPNFTQLSLPSNEGDIIIAKSDKSSKDLPSPETTVSASPTRRI